MGLKACQGKIIKYSSQAAIVLAGGMAKRMGGGCDKAFLNINGEPIIHRQINVLKRIFKRIIIVTNSSYKYEHFKDIEIIPDVVLEKGPIGGIYTGLIASDALYNFVTACDMPFLNEAIIRYMLSNTQGYDVVIPRIDGRYHPLFGIYSKKCVSVIERLIEKGRLNVAGIFSEVRGRYIKKAQLKKFDATLSCLANINTKEDYEACLIGR